MGFLSDFVSNPIGTIGDVGQGVINAVKDHPLEAAALAAAGYYFAPEISAWVAPSGEAIAGTAEGAAAGSTASALTGAQMAKLGLTAASLLAGGSALANATGGTGGLGLTTQDRSGFSSGSANYSPEYYAALQSKYNQYMPQGKGADITTDLKNWYETKYTPQASIAAAPTLATTGTGYSTPTTLTNLNIKPQTVAPLYTALSSNSTADDIAKAYAQVVAKGGGNTVENRQAAVNYLTKLGLSQDQINAAYSKYLSTLPAAGETLAANSTPDQIAKAYSSYVSSSGGDTEANQIAAINYLRNLGVPDATIQASYPIYRASVNPTTPTNTGLLTTAQPVASNTSAASSPSQPLYTSLTSSSSPADIAKAYAQFTAGAGGDTQANQEAAVNYLSNLGISNDSILQAYGLFKG